MNSSPPRRSYSSRSKLGGIAVVALVGVYSFAAPYVNDRFGLELPAIRANADGQVRVVDDDHEVRGSSPSAKMKPKQPTASTETATKPSSPNRTADKSSPPGTGKQARGPLADRMRPSSRGDKQPRKTDQPAASESPAADDGLYGILKEVSRERYVSPAGLLYTPGSAEGHRLEHLRRHTEDDPGRPGNHGVFDGGMEGALKTIDRAYQRAKKGQRTTTKKDRGRTIHTVDMGGRIGFVGGRDGNRKRKPMARRVRIVLDGNRVITAYPM